jgi:hypothetical protein
MQTAPKNGNQRATRRLRGEVIEHFAEVEYAISAVLAHAATLPEYQPLKPTLAHLLGQKLDCLRKLISEAGPLKSQAAKVSLLVEDLKLFEEMRHFMAHGIVEVERKQSGEPIRYVFRMPSASNGLSNSELTLTPPEAQRRTAKLADIARKLASKLKAISDRLDKKVR